MHANPTAPLQFVPLHSSSRNGGAGVPCCLGSPRHVLGPLPAPAFQVVVKGSGLDPATVKAAVAKSGKATEFWQ